MFLDTPALDRKMFLLIDLSPVNHSLESPQNGILNIKCDTDDTDFLGIAILVPSFGFIKDEGAQLIKVFHTETIRKTLLLIILSHKVVHHV